MTTARTIREDELAELLNLYRLLNPDDPGLDPEDVREQWAAMVADDRVEIVVVEHDDRLVSTCVLSITPNLTREARPWAVVENVVTHEDYREQGFASRCLDRATEIAEARDCYKIMLLTGSEKAWKHDFYESCGFEKEPKTGFLKDLR